MGGPPEFTWNFRGGVAPAILGNCGTFANGLLENAGNFPAGYPPAPDDGHSAGGTFT